MAYVTEERVRVDTCVAGVALHMSIEEAKAVARVLGEAKATEDTYHTFVTLVDALDDLGVDY